MHHTINVSYTSVTLFVCCVKLYLSCSICYVAISTGHFQETGSKSRFLLKKIYFFIRVFFHKHWQFTGQQGKEGDRLLSHWTIFTFPRAFRHLIATLHVRWLSRIFNRTACIYQTATRWDLPPYRITIWLIDDVTLVFVCLPNDLILAFFVRAIWDGKPVDSNSNRLSPLYYMRTD